MNSFPGIYRDDKLGTEARRDELLDRRRTELALMPLALSQVFARRIARASAGAAAVVCSLAIMAALANSELFAIAKWIVPGVNIMMIGAMTAAIPLAAYIGATWIAESVFARRMRWLIARSRDAHADLDRLAGGPIEVGRQMVRKADGWAAGFAVAGVLSLGALFAFLVFIVAAAYTIPSAWMESETLSGAPVQQNVGYVGAAIMVCFVASFGIGVACHNEHRRGMLAGWARLIEHRATAVAAAAVFVIVALCFGLPAIVDAQRDGMLPSVGFRAAFALTTISSMFVFVGHLVLRWRRREAARVLVDGK